ncbi:MAG: 4-alpha-glucanotransferase [Desulfarculus sp.]|nr:4-alpha-glucanotransferase [Desulfarculus sp.]
MTPRDAGILLHPTSLPSPFGVGDLGPAAHQFADFLARAGMSLWQMLPLTPTEPGRGNSPYNSASSFAGNPLLISPELLVEDGLLTPEDLAQAPPLSGERVDYHQAALFKRRLMERAFRRANERLALAQDLERFASGQAHWLEDYCLFMALANEFPGRLWNHWPFDIRDRQPQALAAARERLAPRLALERFQQWVFQRQWAALKAHCNRQGVAIIGDMPIYVDFHSADVWANPDQFKLDGARAPWVVAGVPPDYFSPTGQRWGNPVYNWDHLKRHGFAWWQERLGRNLALYDYVRLDHFRGLVAFWEIPAMEPNAVRGTWQEAPFGDFFRALRRRFRSLPIIAEDLGIIDAAVREARREQNLPGMVILMFAFGEDNPQNPYLPHNHQPDSVAYTGTHDNNTLRGWLSEEADEATRQRLYRYLGRRCGDDDLIWEMIRLTLASVAGMAVIPLQDVLGLGSGARMNRPSQTEGNWGWRLLPGQLSDDLAGRLRELAATYGRL